MNHGKYIYTIYHFTPANKFKGGAECRCGGGHDVTLLSQLNDSFVSSQKKNISS